MGIRECVSSMSPFAFPAIRFLLAGLFLLALVRVSGIPLPRRPSDYGRLAGMAFLLVTLGNALLCLGERTVPAGLASNSAALTPVIVIGINLLLSKGDRLRPAGWLGVGIGLTGLWLLVREKWNAGESLEGEFWVLGSCVAWALGAVYVSRSGAAYPPLVLATFQMLFGGALLLPMLFFTGPVFHSPPVAATWLAFAYMVLVGAMAGFGLYNYLLSKISSTQATTIGYLNPVTGIALGALLLGERLSLSQLGGSALLIGAAFLVHASVIRAGSDRSGPSRDGAPMPLLSSERNEGVSRIQR